MDKITEFQGEFRFLSNFWPAVVLLDGLAYPSVEHAYQAAKSLDADVRVTLTTGTAGRAKRLGRIIDVRKDWDDVKLKIMKFLVLQKFSEEPLRSLLLSTGNLILEEGNYWNDTYWGICKGVGNNHLGKILMQVREEIA